MRRLRLRVRPLLASLTPLALMVSGASPAAAETVPLTADKPVDLAGRGYGHGIGMSQWGARGAAVQGKTWRDVVAFYYPGTAVAAQGNPQIRVGITVDSDGVTEVLAASGLRLVANGSATTLPASVGSATPTRWRLSRSGSGLALSWTSGSGWTAYSSAAVPATLPSGAELDNPTQGEVRLVLPGGTTARGFRGALSAVVSGTSARTVNRVAFEDYVTGVLPAEMPASWPDEALRSQAVVARTYARNEQANPRFTGYDTCDTTSCQVYKGTGDYNASTGALRATNSHASAAAAASATSGIILMYAGKPALTQFSSSNGGHTAAGSAPYLVAKPDPWDGAVAGGPQSWTMTGVDLVARLKAAYPAVGTPTRLEVTRDGLGEFGGRITSVTIVGTSGSTTITGAALRTTLGLRSTMVDLPLEFKHAYADAALPIFSARAGYGAGLSQSYDLSQTAKALNVL